MYLRRINQDKIDLKPFFIDDAMIAIGFGYSGFVTVNGQCINFEDGKTLILPPGTLSGCEMEKKDEDGYIFILRVSEVEILNNFFKIELLYDVEYQQHNKSNFVYQGLESTLESFEICQALKDSHNYKLIPKSLQQAIFTLFIEMIENKININAFFSTSNNTPKTIAISKMIKRKPKYNWTLQIVADKLYMSPSSLKRKLKKEDTTFIEVMTSARLGLAINHLTFTNHSVSRVSELCGFNSVTYFCTKFKKKYGVTPSNFRLNSKEVNLIKGKLIA
ncbi:helix-turn-helix transcriptional regulator [Vibrio kanaloae]|uniref:AraC family transcriptional regulator n=1 Tax=Vibrio kanaloae TaxID=170673 RepID=A0A4U1WAM3_9VIBR|nr:helix-turn-helix transcriptional regulator [Vibrio kanaloae]TKE89625.1 AraC family transcriptional regulator [Vibrio kanaloae]TKF12463.1 AraC family transcriptional regulator [Vibrio kanaloae]TKF23656.1 AraC family transcriptional regulator [Vibrio kanaloae]TKF71959.1 AraC family transcriptional regulator [Vibrio kanaloae]